VNRVRFKYSAGALRQPQGFQSFGNLRTFSFIEAGGLLYELLDMFVHLNNGQDFIIQIRRYKYGRMD
jgi:hypothetical protein